MRPCATKSEVIKIVVLHVQVIRVLVPDLLHERVEAVHVAGGVHVGGHDIRRVAHDVLVKRVQRRRFFGDEHFPGPLLPGGRDEDARSVCEIRLMQGAVLRTREGGLFPDDGDRFGMREKWFVGLREIAGLPRDERKVVVDRGGRLRHQIWHDRLDLVLQRRLRLAPDVGVDAEIHSEQQDLDRQDRQQRSPRIMAEDHRVEPHGL